MKKRVNKYKEIYISTDVETEGPIPGEYSMLSLGSVAFAPSGKILGKFYKKLKPIRGTKKHPDVMKFWKENPKIYKEATSKSEPPKIVMNTYVKWLENLKEETGSELIFFGWPVAFDHLFTYWYMVKFVKKLQKTHPFNIPFSVNQSIDFNSFAMAYLKKPYTESRLWETLPKRFSKELFKHHNHRAIDDALIQGKIFIKILKENRKLKK